VIITKDEHLHLLLTRQLTPDAAVATGVIALSGDASALPRLVDLVAFPALDRAPAPQ
jgi:hypothetical protein